MTDQAAGAQTHRRFCPHCRAERNMQVSVTRRKVTDAEGNTCEVLTRTYHCEGCNTFVHSEDVEH